MKHYFKITILLAFLFSTSESYAQSEKETLQNLIENFCRENYSSCFNGRKYVHNTLEIDKVQKIEDNQIKIEGTHSYRGSYGALYEYMEFKIYLTIYSNKVEIVFKKKAKADFFNSTDYWEECSKTFGD